MERARGVTIGTLKALDVLPGLPQFIEPDRGFILGLLEQDLVLAGKGDKFVEINLEVPFFFRGIQARAFPFVARLADEPTGERLIIGDGELAIAEEIPVAR